MRKGVRGRSPNPRDVHAPLREDLLRLFALVVLSGAYAFIAGCAGSAPALDPEPQPAAIEAVSPAADRLARAESEYLEGVRAYVAEDFRAAESRFHEVEEVLAFADSEEAATLDAGDAETILAKAEYFLEKIDQRAHATPPVTVEEAAADAPTPNVMWEVLYGSITPKENRDVERWMSYFLGDGRSMIQKWLDRKARFNPVFNEALARHGLPPELVFHSMIESGYSPHAYSWAHAVGLWQFVRATGRRYGLRSDWWVDERRDPMRATEAAAQYLKELYLEFQDWELALAAYNVGEGRVRKQIARQDTRNFWSLRLPRETKNHIPKFYAALAIGTNPEAFGFSPGQASSTPVAEPLSVEGSVDFEALGECAGVDPDVLADLNPALVRRCTPPDEVTWTVWVPAGTAERAQLALSQLPPESRVRWASHRVRRGETLSKIASSYRTSVSAIMEANRLRSRNRLRVGQELVIPTGRSSGKNAPQYTTEVARSSGKRSASKIATATHTVRRGDTLSTIAQRYGTSTAQLRRLNRIGRHIYPGQRLRVPARGKDRNESFTDAHVLRVQRGDTLWTIAQRTGVSVAALLRANDLGRNTKILPGQTLRIPRD